jgi:hypothetical protein
LDAIDDPGASVTAAPDAAERPPAGLTLQTAGCRALLDAWLAWRGDRLLPRHSDLDPVSIKRILPHIGVIDVRAKDTALFRLAGSGLRDIFGFDPTGRNAVELLPPAYHARRAYRLFVPATRPCGYLGKSLFTYAGGLSDWFESIGLPLETADPMSRNLVVFTLESLLGRRWQRVTGSMIDNPENDFRFVDIGAGTPPSIDPPPDFLTGKG